MWLCTIVCACVSVFVCVCLLGLNISSVSSLFWRLRLFELRFFCQNVFIFVINDVSILLVMSTIFWKEGQLLCGRPLLS